MEMRTEMTFTYTSSETTSYREITINLPEECPRQFSRNIWDQNYESLKNFVHPEPMFEHLVARGLLTNDQQIEFHDRATFIQKRDLVLEAVPKSESDDYLFRFIDCLKMTCEDNQGHTELIALLVESIVEKNQRGFVCPVQKEGIQEFFSNCCTKRWITLYCVLTLVPLVFGSAAVIVLSQTPSVSLTSIRTRYISGNVTISLDFGMPTKWIDSIVLSLECTSRIMVVEGATCEELPTNTRFVPLNETGQGLPLLLYLLPGSFLNVTARPFASEVFIIQSIETYRAFTNQDSGTQLFTCSAPPDNTVCQSTAQSGRQLPVFSVMESDFYSIVTRPLPFQQDFTYQSVTYDLQKIRQDFEVREFTLGPSSAGNSIPVSQFLDLRDKCVFVTPDCGTGSTQPIRYQSIVRRQDILLVPVLVTFGVVLIILALVSLVHLLWVRKNTARISKAKV